MVVAAEWSHLTTVLDEYRARERWAESGSTLTPSDLDDSTKRLMIARFASVVKDLVARNWIELTEFAGVELVRFTDEADLDQVLSDPDSWISSLDGEYRLIELNLGDAWPPER